MAENNFASKVQAGLKALAEQEFDPSSSVAIGIAIESGTKFLNRYEAELTDWQTQLADGDIDEDDLRWLLESRDDLVALDALKKEGLSKESLDRFITGLIDVIISAAKDPS